MVRVHVLLGRDPRPSDHEAELDHEPEQLPQQVVEPVRLGPPLGSRGLERHIIDEETDHAAPPLVRQPLDARHDGVALEEVDRPPGGPAAVLEPVIRPARAHPAAARVPRLLGGIGPHRRRITEVGIRVVPPTQVGEQFYIYEPGTEIILHRYKLPFKQMVVPPKQNELFKWRKRSKEAERLVASGRLRSDGSRNRELAASYARRPSAAAVAARSLREARRAAMWERVASRARVRRLTSVEGEDEDAALTRTVVRSVMEDSRANEPRREMTNEEADAFALELEAELGHRTAYAAGGAAFERDEAVGLDPRALRRRE